MAPSRNTWARHARRCLVVIGAASGLYGLVVGALYANGWWRWQKDGTAIESPSQRYAVFPAVIVYPRLQFGLVLLDRETGSKQVAAGWTRQFPWNKKIIWTADDRLRVECFEQNSLRWGRKTELLGVHIDWLVVPERSK